MMITVTLLEDKGIYTFKLPYGTYMINGQEVIGDYQDVTTKTAPEISRIVEHTEVSHYIHEQTNDIRTAEEYSDMKAALLAAAEYDEDDQPLFADLDDEYKYKVFIRDWKPVYNKIVSTFPVDQRLVRGMMDSGSPYITPMFSLDSSKPDLCIFHKAQLEKDTAMKWARDNDMKLEIPNHGHLRFAKIDNEYVFDDSFDGKDAKITVTFDRAKELLVAVSERVLKRLRQKHTSIQSIDMKVSTLVDRLYAIKNAASESATSHTARFKAFQGVSNSLANLINDINKLT
jgi:hypothetical protein